jgi:hypothetical protein
MAVISILFVVISCIYYEQVISQALFLRPSVETLNGYIDDLRVAYKETEIISLLNSI